MKNMISLKLALRTLKRFRLYTLINAASLILSLVCVLSLSRYIYREATVDIELTGADRVYLITCDLMAFNKDVPPSKAKGFITGTFDHPEGSSKQLLAYDERIIHRAEISSAEKSEEPLLEEGGTRLAPLDVFYADTTFFKMLGYTCIHGTLKLRGENDALIMSDVAEQIFGTSNVVGRTWITKDNITKRVVGVIQRPRCRTTFNFDIVYNVHGAHRSTGGLVQLKDTKDAKVINHQFKNFFENERQHLEGTDKIARLRLISLKEYYKEYFSTDKLLLYSILMVIFLIIGALNYLNLNAVMMCRRQRDFQIKTIFGANKKYIFGELFMEHFIILTTILPFIWLFVYLARQPLHELFSIPLDTDIRFDILLTVSLPLVSGLLFALFSFTQIQHQGLASSEKSIVPVARRSSYARITYLFVQYAITFGLIVFALYLCHNVYRWFYGDRGYRHEHVLQCDINSGYIGFSFNTATRQFQNPHRDFLLAVAPQFENKLGSTPYFEEITFGPTPYSGTQFHNFTTDDGKAIQAFSMQASKDWMDFFQLKFIHGRNWTNEEQMQVGGINYDSKTIPAGKSFSMTDFTKFNIPLNNDGIYKIIVNETLWEQLSPQQRKSPFYIEQKGNNRYDERIKVQIVGVVQNYSLWKLDNKPYPMVFYLECSNGYYGRTLFATIKPGKEKEAIHYLKDLHEHLCPHGTFECKWLGDDLYTIHKDNIKAVKSVSVFAIIAILISCLGLFGISLYDIRSRYKEIALRKINGARNKEIYRILFRKYALALIGASLVATPFTYWGVTEYMRQVDNHAPLTVWIFLAAFLILVFVSLLTLFVQVHRAVHINAAEVMKSE